MSRDGSSSALLTVEPAVQMDLAPQPRRWKWRAAIGATLSVALLGVVAGVVVGGWGGNLRAASKHTPGAAQLWNTNQPAQPYFATDGNYEALPAASSGDRYHGSSSGAAYTRHVYTVYHESHYHHYRHRFVSWGFTPLCLALFACLLVAGVVLFGCMFLTKPSSPEGCLQPERPVAVPLPAFRPGRQSGDVYHY